MSRQHFLSSADGSTRGASASVLLALLCSLPFFVPMHLPPVPSFHSEWLAGLLGILLITSCFFRSAPTLVIPHVTMMPGLFVGAVIVQEVTEQNYFYQQSLLYCAYLIFASVLIVTGKYLVGKVGREKLFYAMATGFALGALAQCVSGLLQWQGVVMPGFTPLLHGRGIYGNLAQQNNLTDYLWLGGLSLTYLFGSHRIGWQYFLPAIIPVSVIAAYTGSRSAVLYPLACLALSAMFASRSTDLGTMRLLTGLRTLCFVALACLALPQLSPPPVAEQSTSGVERLVSAAVEGASGSVRLQLLNSALRAGAENPLTGSGVGSVPLQSLRHGPADSASGFGVAEHFHNIVANWLVEFGVPVTFAALLLVVLWLHAVLRQHTGPEKLFGLLLLSIVGLHSLLEYPLWYSFFMAPVALILGALDPREKSFPLSGVTQLGALGSLLFALLLMFNLWQDHSRLSDIYLLPPSGPQAEKVWKAQVDDLLLLHRESLFAPHINGMLIVTADVDRKRLESKHRVCEAALHFSPAPAVIFKCAALYVLAGRRDEGLKLVDMGKRSFPSEAKSAYAEMNSKVSELPELAILTAYLAQP